MKRSDFHDRIKGDRCQVFLLASPVPFPLNFAVHLWFVINLNGSIERWEFGKFRNSPHPNNIGVLKDFLGPFTGMNKFFWKARPRWNSWIVDSAEGELESQVGRLALFISNHSFDYPHRHRYAYLGPNSNTYIGWVLKETGFRNFNLPSNAIGLNYKNQLEY